MIHIMDIYDLCNAFVCKQCHTCYVWICVNYLSSLFALCYDNNYTPEIQISRKRNESLSMIRYTSVFGVAFTSTKVFIS